MICCQVDDILWGGSVTFNSRITRAIKNTFLISQESLGSFKYVGLSITQGEDFISMYRCEYISEIKEVEITKERASQKDEPLAVEEARQLRRVAGQLNWASIQTCPNMAYDSCILSTSLMNRIVQDLLMANKNIRKMKCETVTKKFNNLGDMSSFNIVIYSYVSLGNLKDGGSQRGFLIFLEGENKKFGLASQVK